MVRASANWLSLELPAGRVVTVAMHRLPPAVKILGELLRFCRDEWVAPMMGRLGLLHFGVGRLRGMREWKHTPDSDWRHARRASR
jgi:hypothetical protein